MSRLKSVLIVVLGLAVVVMVGTFYLQSRQEVDRVKAETENVPEVTTVEESDFPDRPPVTSLDESMGRLAKKDRTFTIVIVGDSTGISERGWQRLTTKWLGETTGRPVIYHQWYTNDPPDNYYDPFEQVPGEGAPIEVWNTSAGGKSFAYQDENYAKQLPASVKTADLILINHGHNISPPSEYYYVGVPFMTKLLDRWPDASMILTEQNPEDPATGNAERLVTSTFGYVSAFAESREIPILDVYSAFEKTGRPLELIDSTLFHPTPEGYELWFEQLRAMLKPHLPAKF